MKYIYKYLHKRHDAATVVVGGDSNGTVNYDEVESYLTGQYI